MIPWWAYALGVGAVLAVAVKSSTKYSFGRPDDKKKGISRDPDKLLPAFADKLELLFQAMWEDGEDAILHEGWRSKERSLMLAEKGTGSVDSLHQWGAAADIISKSKGWSDPKFFKKLAENARKVGLYPGYDWDGDEYDPPHVQAVPGTTSVQNALRASKQPNEFIKRYMG